MKRALVGIMVAVVCGSVAGCAPNVGHTIETPALPTVAAKAETRARLGSSLTVQNVEDVRTNPGTANEDGFTEPVGGVGQMVEGGLRDAFKEAGISMLDSAPVALRGEVRRWRAKVDAKADSIIASEATLYVEVLDPSGKKLYTGTYNGTRSSNFPVASREDVKDSLGLAMAHAISQVVSDPQLLSVLGSY